MTSNSFQMLPDTLNAIEAWLRQHAERIAASLRPPATEVQLAQLEAAVGQPLPADFKQLYRWHDGLTDEENMGNLFYGFDFWPLSRVTATYSQRQPDASPVPLTQADPQLVAANQFNPGWVQFGDDGSRTGLFLDLAPSPAGTYGQVLFLDPVNEAGLLVASSATALAGQFLADLRAGLYELDADALEEEGNHFLATDRTINLLSWYHSTRWQR